MSIITIGMRLANITTSRASVIPFTYKENKLYFLLGQDRESGDITDLGGGVKQHETSLAGALRELGEESDGIFGELSPNDTKVSQAIALLDNHRATLFIPLSEEWFEKAPKLFESQKILAKKKSHNEMKCLIWVDEESFVSITKGGFIGERQLWRKLRRFYYDGYNVKLRNALITSIAINA